jgi:hypothetical protein
VNGEVLRACMLLLLQFVIAVASLLPTELRAQICTLNSPLPTTIVDATPGTTFLPSRQEGQIVVRKKPLDSSVVHVFETSGPDPASWKVLSESEVLSIRPAPENAYDGFSPADSSIIRFIVPALKNSFWVTHTFVIRFCEQGGGAWAIVMSTVSSPTVAKIISLGVLLLGYLGFALAVSKVRDRPHPLVVKYPSFAHQKNYSWLERLDPVVLTANAFHKGSIQKLQVLLFSFLVTGMVLSFVLTLGVLSDLSGTVALLLGISAVGAAVAQKTTTTRDRLSFENWAWLIRKGILPINEEDSAGPRWSDLVMTGREFDVYKLQTLIFSVVVAVALLFSGQEHLSSFTVPQTLLGILGLSQVAYVAGTLVGPPSIADLDQAIKKLRETESKLQTAVARNTDTDGEGKLPEPLPEPPVPLPALQARVERASNARRIYSKEADQVEIMLESTLGIAVNRGQLEPAVN